MPQVNEVVSDAVVTGFDEVFEDDDPESWDEIFKDDDSPWAKYVDAMDEEVERINAEDYEAYARWEQQSIEVAAENERINREWWLEHGHTVDGPVGCKYI